LKPAASPLFVDELIQNSEKRAAISGNLLLTTTLSGRSVTTPAVLLVAFPDKLRLEIQDPMGGILGLLVLSGEKAWLYLQDKPEIYTGPFERLPFGLFPRVSPEELVRIFLARPYAEHLRHSDLANDSASYHAGDLSELVLWNPSLAEPGEWRQARLGQGGSNVVYEDYSFHAGLRYPTKVKLAVKDAQNNERDLTLVWKDWDATVPKEKKLFQIPQQETYGRKIKALP